MTDLQVDELPIDIETSKTKKSNDDKTKILLYIAMGLSAWGDRMWQFAVGIYFISLNPTNLQGVAINGIVLNLAVILCGAAIGDWIDRNPRLPTLRKALYAQNLSVLSMALLVVIALYDPSRLPTHWTFIIQGFLIAIGTIATLASVACKVSVSRDWVVALYASNRQNLAKTNATLRRIDLISGVLAPVLTGAIMAFLSRWASAIFIAGWNVVSLVLELFLYTKVYRSAETVLAYKASAIKSNDQKSKKKEGGLSKLFSSIKGLSTYRSLSTCLPGVSIALLYMTVLSFDSITRAYVIEQGLSEVLLGGLNGLGSILGIIGTLVYPIFVKRTGLVRTGVIGFWSEFAMLMLCLLSLFSPGSPFAPLRYFTTASCDLYGTFIGRSNSTATTTTHPCSNSKFSVLLLVMGITLNRFGLWIADLTVNQLQQERVPEDVRGRIGGTQQALNEFFDMLRYTLIVILPRMHQFGFHVGLSVLSVFCASMTYTFWSCSAASQVVPPSTEVEMADLNGGDISNEHEAEIGEKLEFVDGEPSKV